MDDVNTSFTNALDSLVTSIQQLNQLLLDDNDYFVANDLVKINESNDKKNKILLELGSNMKELDDLIPVSANGAKLSLSEYVNQLDASTANYSRRILDNLYDSLSTGYNNLVTNNHVVVANLGFINSVWDSLLTIAKQSDGIYTKPELK